ncbi:LysR family transcriptional regulator [Kineosporia succinea]|uniref:DNA-binding transcriptional LysR family regulator n=1 Tax=Kineosporia succinea TaxID=84632 RepID=A0ABT9PEE0_9ACTN|nr:LysR family transcriptional regulator [Kineosporia succinea]MDP9831085.1 DNA-binding transcriptional LysR family regulator [Kineosporia succinea]
MRIDPRRLRFLLAIAREGGVLAAADALGVTPSAVSQQLARLEAETGCALVTRTTHGILLTDAGQALAEAAEEIERALNLVRAKLLEDEVDPVGTVRVGLFHSFLRVGFAPHLPEWKKRHPRLRLEIREDDQEELLRMLRSGDLDIVILEFDAQQSSPRLAKNMTEIPLLDEPWRLVVPSAAHGVDVVDIARQSLPSLPWLGLDASAAGSEATRRVRRALGVSDDTVHLYQDINTALALVAAGEGMALVPSLALIGTSHPGVTPLEMPGLGTRRIVARRYEGRNVPEAQDVAMGLIREAAAAVSLEEAVS